jgi:hypothetical protein
MPRLLQHPADAPPPLEHVSATESLRSFRSAWASQAERALSRSLSIRFRSWVGRITGRSDRYLTSRTARAIDDIAAHCDALTERVTALEALTSEVAGAFGQELALLRAEVQHLQRTVASQVDSGDSAH